MSKRHREDDNELAPVAAAIDRRKSPFSQPDTIPHIVQYLDGSSLFHFAQVDRSTLGMIKNVYAKRFRRKLIYLRPGFEPKVYESEYFGGSIFVDGRQNCFDFIDMFGELMAGAITINFLYESAAQAARLNRMIGTNCASIRRLKLKYWTGDMKIYDFHTAFANVYELSVAHSYLSDQFQLLPQTFPALERLQLKGVIADSYAAHFPELYSIRVRATNDTIDKIARLWQMNDDLEILRLIGVNGLSIQKLLDSTVNNPMITVLEMSTNVREYILRYQIDRLQQEHVRLEKLWLWTTQFTTEYVELMISNSINLQDLLFFYCEEFDDPRGEAKLNSYGWKYEHDRLKRI